MILYKSLIPIQYSLLNSYAYLQKVVSHSEQKDQQNILFPKLQDKPFWIWKIKEHKQEDIKTNGDYCFNHIIGLPQNDGIDKPH